MVKKLKAMAAKKSAAGAGLFDNALASSVRESAQQIWLAGMGAFAKAQAEGKQRFEALIGGWPQDVSDYVARLAYGAPAAQSS